MKLKPFGIPRLIQHKGWTIWKWTGWKGSKGLADHNLGECHICNKPILDGHSICVEQAMPYTHWTCKYPHNPIDRIMGQWLAQKGESPHARYMYVNVDNTHPGYMDGGEYLRGDSFPISIGGEAITEHTPDAVREIAKQLGLKRLKYLIGQIEAREVPEDAV